MSYTDFDMRMKRYEYVSRNYLVRRMPVIMRIDGKAFHSFTQGFQRPFDSILHQAMNQTMKYLCENIQGCVFGYTQSDEITLILKDYNKITSQGWFNYNVQKMCSIGASMATYAFNRYFKEIAEGYQYECATKFETEGSCGEGSVEFNYCCALSSAISKGAMFDCRAFNIPKEDVCNNLIWRQQDSTRNSIQLAGQSYFSHNELNKKSTDKIQEMLFSQKGINWNDYPTEYKRGVCCIKNMCEVDGVQRNQWMLDYDIPIFTKDRNYIESRI